MTDSILLSYNGIEIYKSEIDILCDDYINSLPNPDMIFKSTVFSGMLNYLHQTKIKYIIAEDKQRKNINPYNHDYDFLDKLFYNVYVYLCTRFNICPTIIQFSTLANVNSEMLGDIKQGIYRQNGVKVNPLTCQLVRKWYDFCESSMLGKAINESSIGSMFALKSVYGYRDNDQRIEVTTTAEQNQTPEQIAERYKDAKKPELPETAN